jgi:hypothetical protein
MLNELATIFYYVWWSGGINRPFFILVLEINEWAASRSGCFTTSVQRSCNLAGGSMIVRADLYAIEHRKSIACTGKRTLVVAIPTEILINSEQ